MNRNIRFSTFIRYLVSYAVIFAIPVFSAVFLSYSFFVKAYKEEIINGNIETLIQVKNAFELKIEQMDKIVKQIEAEDDFTAYDLANSPQLAIKVKKRLINYQITSGFISEIYFYPRGHHTLYASSSTYTASKFIDTICSYTNWSQEEFLADINSIKDTVWRPSEEINMGGYISDYVTFLYPLPGPPRIPYSTVMMQIDKKVFTSMMEGTQPNHKGNTLILDYKGNLIVSLKNDNDIVIDSLSKLIDNQGMGTYIEKINNEDFLISYINSNNGGWFYIKIIAEKDALQKVNSIRNLFTICIIIVVLLGIIAIYFFMHINYKPIKSLRDFTKKYFSEIPEITNEVDTTKQIMINLSESTKMLTSKLEDQMKSLKELLFLSLISGKFKNIAEFNTKANITGISFSKTFFRVIVIQMEKGSLITDPEAMFRRINTLLNNQAETFSLYKNNENRIMLLLSTETNKNEFVKTYLREIQKNLTEEQKIKTIIGIGNCYEDTLRLYMSHLEATTAVDYGLVCENSNTVFFDEMMTRSTRLYSYPLLELDALQDSIQNGDSERIDAIINELHKNFSTGTNIVAAKLLCYDIMNIVFKSSLEISKCFSNISSNYNDIMELLFTNSIEELGNIIKRIFHKIKQALEDGTSGEEKNGNIEKIIAYIKESYINYDFSIQTIAENFEMSVNNLSQQFKRYTGYTPLEYVTILKIEKAKEMLLETNLPLKEIIGNIGYYDESSFIKKFKLHIGATPGQYRRNHKM